MSRGWATEPHGEYPVDWKQISYKAKKAAGWKCEHCGMAFGNDGKALVHKNANNQPSILTVHHINGDKSNCSWDNLLVCCQACHLHIQALWGPGDYLPARWRMTPAWIIRRGLPYIESQQMRMEL